MLAGTPGHFNPQSTAKLRYQSNPQSTAKLSGTNLTPNRPQNSYILLDILAPNRPQNSCLPKSIKSQVKVWLSYCWWYVTWCCTRTGKINVTESGKQTLYKKWDFWRTRKQTKLYSHPLQAWTRKLLTALSSQQRRLKFLHPTVYWKRARGTGVKLKGKLKWLAENGTSDEACKVVTYSRRKRDIKTLIVLLSQQMRMRMGGEGGGTGTGRGASILHPSHRTGVCYRKQAGID